MRPAKVFGNFFVLIVLCVMALIYYTYVFIVWGPKAEGKPQLFISTNSVIVCINRGLESRRPFDILQHHLFDVALVILLDNDY